MFVRAQLSAVVATAVDFGSLYLFHSVWMLPLALSTASAALLGAITNFLINRYWSFQSGREKSLTRQGLLYSAVSLGSAALNTLGVVWFTNQFHVPYLISKGIIASLVAVFYNYPLHKRIVFSSKKR